MIDQRTSVASVECPECAGLVGLKRQPMVSEILRCAGCGVELEVVGTNPITVALAPEIEEDWGE